MYNVPFSVVHAPHTLVQQPMLMGGVARSTSAASVSRWRWNDIAANSAPVLVYFSLSKCSNSDTSCASHGGRVVKYGSLPSRVALGAVVPEVPGTTRSMTHGRNLMPVAFPALWYVSHTGVWWQINAPRTLRRGDPRGMTLVRRSVSSSAEKTGCLGAGAAEDCTSQARTVSGLYLCLRYRLLMYEKKLWPQITKSYMRSACVHNNTGQSKRINIPVMRLESAGNTRSHPRQQRVGTTNNPIRGKVASWL